MLEKKHDYLSFTFGYDSFDRELEVETNQGYRKHIMMYMESCQSLKHAVNG